MRRLNGMIAAVGLATASCLGGMPTSQPSTNTATDPTAPSDQLTAGGVKNTFEHPQDGRDPFDILQQKQEEGPPTVSTRLHSCQKMSYATLGHLLQSRGVNLDAT